MCCSDGRILDIGSNREVLAKWKDTAFEATLDATGKCILPGFVDAHTHPVWSGDRVHEFKMKLQGATYMEIYQKGGGIHFTVEETRKSSDEQLYESLKARLMKMLHSGTTTVECKSGYGLDTNAEVRLLYILQRAKLELPIDVVITYCGAHAVKRGMTSDEAKYMIIHEQIPKIRGLIDQNILSVENIDVFCENGVFDTEQSKRILEAGKKIGLRLNFHGDELHPCGGAEMGSTLGATAISHLEEVSDQGITDMAKAGVVAVVLPTTAFFMRLKSPPVRRMIEAGVPIALGSDFNPNAFCMSMPVVMGLACVNFGLSLEEALTAATINSAASLGRSHTHGSIVPGKVCDLVILDADKWENIIYQFGEHANLIDSVVKAGKIVYRKNV